MISLKHIFGKANGEINGLNPDGKHFALVCENAEKQYGRELNAFLARRRGADWQPERPRLSPLGRDSSICLL